MTTTAAAAAAVAICADTDLIPNYHNGIYYPDSDGEPLPDGFYQEPLFYQVAPVLRAYLEQFYDVLVSGDTFLYYEEGNPRRFVSPDCYITFGVGRDAVLPHNSYWTWHIGKPPDFVLEIASISTAEKDLGEKALLYAALGILEYWLYDASPDSRFYGAPLIFLLLQGDRYVPVPLETLPDGRVRGYSPTLGLYLYWDDGRLRFHDPVRDVWLPDLYDALEALTAAEDRAEAAVLDREAARAQAAAESQARARAQAQAAAEREEREAAQAQAAAEREEREAAQAQAAAESQARVQAEARANVAEADAASAQAQANAAEARIAAEQTARTAAEAQIAAMAAELSRLRSSAANTDIDTETP